MNTSAFALRTRNMLYAYSEMFSTPHSRKYLTSEQADKQTTGVPRPCLVIQRPSLVTSATPIFWATSAPPTLTCTDLFKLFLSPEPIMPAAPGRRNTLIK